jgi:thymidylate kinase
VVLEAQEKDNKLIVVEGLQGTGKSTLIRSLPDNKYYKFKLSPIKFTSIFNIKNDNILFGATIGRDLSILNLYSQLDKPIIMDRGILSPLVYKHTRKYFIDGMSLGYLQYIKNILKIDSIRIIYLKGYNPLYIRNRKDGYDNISLKLQNELYDHYIKYLDTDKIIEFTNNFDDLSIIRFKVLLEDIIEYKRF